MSGHRRFSTALLSLSLFTLGLSPIGCTSNTQLSGDSERRQTPVVDLKAIVSSTTTADDKAIPKYDHIFVIVEENKGYDQIIGNPKAPNINQLAKTYGLASQFYGIVHPSEANYIVMLGGSTFGIHDDDAFYCQAGSPGRFCGNAKTPGYANHTIASKSLINQLEQKGLTWKGYFEGYRRPWF